MKTIRSKGIHLNHWQGAVGSIGRELAQGFHDMPARVESAEN